MRQPPMANMSVLLDATERVQVDFCGRALLSTVCLSTASQQGLAVPSAKQMQARASSNMRRGVLLSKRHLPCMKAHCDVFPASNHQMLLGLASLSTFSAATSRSMCAQLHRATAIACGKGHTDLGAVMLCQILVIKLNRLAEASDCCMITAASVAQHFHLCFADGCHRLQPQLLKQVNRTCICLKI